MSRASSISRRVSGCRTTEAYPPELRLRASAGPRNERPERRGRPRLIARRPQDEEASPPARAPGQPAQELQGRGVCPLQSIDRQRER